MVMRSARTLMIGCLVVTTSAWAAPTPATPTKPPLQTTNSKVPGWLGELPDAAKVAAVFDGPDYPSKQRNEAAFAVLADYVEIRAGVSQPADGRQLRKTLAPAVFARWGEYTAHGWSRLLSGATGNSRQLFDTPSFRHDVLSRFVPRASVAVYESSPQFKQAVADFAAYQQEHASERKQQEATATAVAATSAAEAARLELIRAKAKAFLDPDLKAAKAAHIPTNVLSIEFGQPINFPACPAADPNSFSDVFVGVSPLPTACAVRSTGVSGLFNRMAITGDFSSLDGTTDTVVRLPASKCPDWLACTLVVTTKDDLVIAVSLLTAKSVSFQDVESRLTQKYGGRAPTTGPDSKCQLTYQGRATHITEDAAPSKIWNVPGVGVTYVPYGSMSNCDQGAVVVQLNAVMRLRTELKRQHDAEQPQF
jgi:hypothetical protein